MTSIVSRDSTGKGRSGFTLIELLLVLAILTIFATVSYPIVHGLIAEESLDAATKEVEAALNYARLVAIASGNPTRVRVGAPEDSLVVLQLRSHEYEDILNPTVAGLPQALTETETFERVQNLRRPSGLYEIHFPSDPLFRGIEVEASSFGPPGTPVIFDAFGKPSHGGAVTLAGAAGRTVIEVDGFTGRVTIR